MFERVIYLEGIDPIQIFGINNSSFETIKSAFPKLKLIARGNEIKALGERNAIDDFEDKIGQLIGYYDKYQSLSKDEIIEILLTSGKQNLKSGETEENVLIYGHSGKIIKARTPNQLKLSEEF